MFLNRSDASDETAIRTFSFILNTQPHTVKIGHWVAVFVTLTTIEYYDSLVGQPPSTFMKRLKPFLKPGQIYQYKVNTVKRQSNKSNNCGYYAMEFITDRYKGKTYKEPSHFKVIEDSVKGEQDIARFKKTVKKFGFVK